jgi:hypothetical protein
MAIMGHQIEFSCALFWLDCICLVLALLCQKITEFYLPSGKQKKKNQHSPLYDMLILEK